MFDKIKIILRNSRFQGIFLFPIRVLSSFKSLILFAKNVTTWLIKSAEHTNYTYELTNRNIDHLAWFVCNVTGISHSQAISFFEEVLSNSEFSDFLVGRQKSTGVREFDAGTSRVGRRLAWYAIVRALQPKLVVETGTDKGLGTILLAEAIRNNGRGKVISIDINPGAGQLFKGSDRYKDEIELEIGDSINKLMDKGSIDIFIHDSNHSGEHEFKEFEIISAKLSQSGLVMTDNGHATDALSNWAKMNDFDFYYFQENPKNHWYSGASLSIAKKHTVI